MNGDNRFMNWRTIAYLAIWMGGYITGVTDPWWWGFATLPLLVFGLWAIDKWRAAA